MPEDNSDSSVVSGLYFDDPEQFISEMPCPAMMKDKSGVYVFSNQKCADLFGIATDDIVGLSVISLNQSVKNRWEESYDRTIESLDYTVLSKGEMQKDISRTLPVSDGFLRLQDTIKYPILTPITKRVAGVITFSYDRTAETGLLNLFKLYLRFYGNRRQSVSFFWHLSISLLFSMRCLQSGSWKRLFISPNHFTILQ